MTNTDYAATYQAMADEELLVLSSESANLGGDAQAALQKELTRRELSCDVGQQADLPASRRRGASGLPVRGWLLVLIAYMIWEAIYRFLALERANDIIWGTVASLSIKTPPGLSAVMGTKALVYLLLSVFTLYAAAGLARKWRHSLKIAKISLLASVICSILFSVLVNAVLSDTPIRAYLTTSIFAPLNLLSWDLPNIGWLLYLRQSRRVRLTYRKG